MRHARVTFGALLVWLIFAARASPETAQQDQGRVLWSRDIGLAGRRSPASYRRLRSPLST
jgi:hypothetical protein